MPEAISDKLAHGGVAIFASAAAVTVGRFSLPVYEIYKVGKPIHWLDGLDLLSPLGFGAHCVVVPHFDNAEGGTHDTRFCYMGERRLAVMEELLPRTPGCSGSTSTPRSSSTSTRGRDGDRARCRHRAPPRRRGAVSRGDAHAHDVARRRRARRTRVRRSRGAAPDTARDPAESDAPRPKRSALLDEVARLEQAFVAALAARKAGRPRRRSSTLDRTILDWSADTLQTDEPDRARAVLHSLVHRLGEAASVGLRDPKEVLAPSSRGSSSCARSFAPRRRGKSRTGSATAWLPAGSSCTTRPGARPGRLAPDGRPGVTVISRGARPGSGWSASRRFPERVVIPSGPMRVLVLSSRLTDRRRAAFQALAQGLAELSFVQPDDLLPSLPEHDAIVVDGRPSAQPIEALGAIRAAVERGVPLVGIGAAPAERNGFWADLLGVIGGAEPPAGNTSRR